MSENKKWWYAKDGEKYGPYSSREMKFNADAGVILPEYLVWKEGAKGWVKASSVNGLFGKEVKTNVPPPLPFSNSSLGGEIGANKKVGGRVEEDLPVNEEDEKKMDKPPVVQSSNVCGNEEYVREEEATEYVNSNYDGNGESKEGSSKEKNYGAPRIIAFKALILPFLLLSATFFIFSSLHFLLFFVAASSVVFIALAPFQKLEGIRTKAVVIMAVMSAMLWFYHSFQVKKEEESRLAEVEKKRVQREEEMAEWKRKKELDKKIDAAAAEECKTENIMSIGASEVYMALRNGGDGSSWLSIEQAKKESDDRGRAAYQCKERVAARFR